jgi:hypothetical protein
MPNKLKNLNITKVDLVPEGANPDAFVTMYKSKTPIRKSGEAESFADKLKDIKLDDVVRQIWQYTESLSSSLISILRDDNIIQSDKKSAMDKSLEEFYGAATLSTEKWSGGSVSDYVATGSEELQTATIVKALKAETLGILKSNNEGADNDMKIEDIDKDKLTDEEKKQLEAIVNKAGITKPEDDDNGKNDNKDDKNVKKIKDEPINHDPEDIYKGLHPAVAAELKSLRKARDESEERELTAIAKKYEVIGKKSEELIPTLKSLKAAGGTAYQDMIGVLDTAVEAVEKSGAFIEIGKSGHSDVAGSTTIAKARTIADEIKKSNPTMSDTEAMAKTWETHPELMEDYDNEIGG